MRLLQHPGPVAPARRAIAWGEAAACYRLTIAEGEDLMAGLTDALAQEGVRSAGIVLLGGAVARLALMTGRPTDAGEQPARVAAHSGPHEIACPATLVGGNAILGLAADEEPLVHCHALFVDAAGVMRGGHLLPGRTIAGPGGLRLHASTLARAAFKVGPDRETGFDIFQPEAP